MDKEENILQDKDKPILVVNVWIDINNKHESIDLIHQAYEYYRRQFDETVKVLVSPVYEKHMQKIELLNAKECDNEILENLNKNFKKFIESFSK